MKFVKGISFFVIYPLAFMGAGFIAGVESTHFFYPGQEIAAREETVEEVDWEAFVQAEIVKMQQQAPGTELAHAQQDAVEDAAEQGYAEEHEIVAEVASAGETLSVDTEYVLEETDIVNHTVVEITERLPMKYVGLDRTQFLEAMESYEENPPLSEKERGFIGLEVLSFSRERVVVQMNYEYQQPGEGFYLAIKDNEVVVYKEDLETIYINTGILVEQLPYDVQEQLIQMIWVAEEQELYNFLENYSS